MIRILRLSALAGAFVAAALLTPVAQREANAGPLFRALTGGGYYYNGGYAPGYGGYSGYGYGPYGYGGNVGYGYNSPYGYANDAPGPYVAPSYRSYGIGNGFGTGGTYNGAYNQTYSHSLFFPDRPAYSPYGYGVYGPNSVYVN
jgi:hypothetical protein